MAFTRHRVAVFVDGCFWHGCPDHGTAPRSNSEWWRAKLEANRARDADTDRVLRGQGWLVMRYWEHEAPERAAREISEVLAVRAESPLSPPRRR